MTRTAEGAELLDDVEEFLRRFVSYPSESARVAHVLWIAHAWLMDQWESTPRLAFLSAEPGSGKSRALEVTAPLVPRVVHAVNVSPSYLFRKVADPEGLPTVLYDEIDTIFGAKANGNEDLRGLLNAGHRKGATAGRCEVRGKTVVPVEFPAYCAVALAGLDDLPDTVASRSVIVRMRRRAPGDTLEQWRFRIHEPEGQALAVRLADWVNTLPYLAEYPEPLEGVQDRNADVWEPLIMCADAAGGDWPERARAAAVAMVAAAKSNERVTMGVMLLRDLRDIFAKTGADALSTESLLEQLNGLDGSPWGGYGNGNGLTPRQLAQKLRKYQDADGEPVAPGTVRLAEGTAKGYKRAQLTDAWTRYLPAPTVDPEPTGCPIHGSTPNPEACYTCEKLARATAPPA